MSPEEKSHDKILSQPSNVPTEEQGQEASTKSKFKGITEKLSGALGFARQEYERSEAKAYVDQLSSDTKRFLDEKGVTEHVSKAYDATQDHLDVVSGTKILRLVEERLELQEKYNDILATKLFEALKRIEALEACLEQRDKK